MRSTRPLSSRTHTDPKPIPSRIGNPPTLSRATIRPVRGLTRSIAFASRSATHSEPKPTASPIGALKPVTILLTLFFRGSIRVTTPKPDDAPQWAPAAQIALSVEAIKPHGWPDRSHDNLTVAETAFVVGSTRITASSLVMVTQTPPSPALTAMRSVAVLAGPSRMVATTWFVAGSMREMLGPPLFATHTAPSDTAIPNGRDPTLIVAVTAFVLWSMRETVWSSRCVTQTAPLPAAASPH